MYRTIFCSLSLVLLSFLGVFAKDVVILRNGDEVSGKIVKVSDREVVLSKSSRLFSSENGRNLVIPASKVYMVKSDKKRSTFFVNGERIIKESPNHDKSADLIYLVKGEEIEAWEVQMKSGILSYQKDKKQKRAMSNVGAFPKEEVFMVVYSDGSKDIFTEISEDSTVSQNKEKTDSDEHEQPQLKVVFHNVLQGETLGKIAEEKGVSVNDIIEWNELPGTYKATTTLKAGTQLMLQIKL